MVGRRRGAWLAAAAIAFGLACAGKYLYGVVGLAIVIDWALRVRATEEGAGPRLRGLVPILGFLALGAVAFLAADPYLWPDPVGRLISSITLPRRLRGHGRRPGDRLAHVAAARLAHGLRAGGLAGPVDVRRGRGPR